MFKLFSMLNLSLSIHQINNFTNQCTRNFFSPTNTIPCIKCFANDVTVFSRNPEVHPIILSSKKTSKCNISFKVDLSKLTNTKEEEIVAVKIVVVVLVIAIVAKTAAVVVASHHHHSSSSRSSNNSSSNYNSDNGSSNVPAILEGTATTAAAVIMIIINIIISSSNWCCDLICLTFNQIIQYHI